MTAIEIKASSWLRPAGMFAQRKAVRLLIMVIAALVVLLGSAGTASAETCNTGVTDTSNGIAITFTAVGETIHYCPEAALPRNGLYTELNVDSAWNVPLVSDGDDIRTHPNEPVYEDYVYVTPNATYLLHPSQQQESYGLLGQLDITLVSVAHKVDDSMTLYGASGLAYSGFLAPGTTAQPIARSGCLTKVLAPGMSAPDYSCLTDTAFVISVALMPTPTVTSLSPNGGSTLGGTSVTIVGTHFSPSGNVVTFGGTAGTVTAESTTAITVTAPAHATGSFDIVVTTADGKSATVTHAYLYVAVTLAPTGLPGGKVGNAYSKPFSASGGTGPYGYALTGGSLPAGMTLSTGGTLSGTPTAGGNFTFQVTATDASAVGSGGPFTATRGYTLNIAAATISVAPASLPDGTSGSAYSQTITASGGTAPYSYAVTVGTLPAGLTLSNGGLLSGTPGARGSYDFTVTATDSSTGTGPFSANKAYRVTIAGSNPRSWVSGTGDDANPCTRALPCRSFAGAFAVTMAGGEINCRDAGEFGAVTITRAVAIVCDTVHAGVLVAAGDGITINAEASDSVTLSGLDIHGAGAPGNGIRLLSAGALHIVNTRLHGFVTANHAIAIVPTGGVSSVMLDRVSVSESGRSGSGGGMLVSPESNASVLLTVERSRFQDNAFVGLHMTLVGKSAASIRATIDRSMFTNDGTGLVAKAPAGTGIVQLTLLGSTVARNTTGVVVNSPQPALFTDNTITANDIGLMLLNGGSAMSLGDNRLSGNVTDGAFTSTVARR
ncbi:putative Ig domain-containing protein [Sphingomonas sp. RT2P30]|uniref:putative Ig domain-containing protein n=1 Tax=Parasphingomonas halimpatiens TaxID=3096162 RepID=UPI002FC5C56E